MIGYKRIKLARMDPGLVGREIGDFVINEIASIGKSGGIVGLSGGVDSTCVAAITKSSFDLYNSLSLEQRATRYNPLDPRINLELVGYLLPSKLNARADEDDGRKVAERLGIRYELINIEPLVEANTIVQPEVMANRFDKGNQISELRALVLHGQAAHEKKLVIGTGNRDEDFGVAFYTLFGDGAVHLSPIGDLPKRLVRQMAVYKGFPDLAFRVSTPGLEPNQTSFGDLGYHYETVEPVGEGIRQGFDFDEIITDSTVIRLAESDIREYHRLFGKQKFKTVDEVVKDIFRRNKIARAKAGIVSPPIAKITLEYE